MSLKSLQKAGVELTQRGFTEPNVRRQLHLPEGLPADGYLHRLERPFFPLPLPGLAPTPLDTLIRLFLCGASVPVEELRGALTAATVRTLETHGVLKPRRRHVHAEVTLVPWNGLLLVVDRAERRVEREAVFFPDVSAVCLSRYLSPLPHESRERAVDVGTGSGVLAFLLAKEHGFRKVTAVDLNPRALELAKLGAALNGLFSLTFVQASASELTLPKSRRADLLTFALPQVYSTPSSRSVAVFANEGEKLLTEVYAHLPRWLAPGGRAVLWHQIRLQPEAHFPQLWSSLPELQSDGLTWVASRDVPPVEVEFGVALVERNVPYGLRRMRAPGGCATRTRADLEPYFRTQTLLHEGGEALQQSVPTLHPGLALQSGSVVHEDRLQPTLELFLDRLRVPRTLLPLLERVDGRRSVAALVAQHPGEEHATLNALAYLAHEGVLTLA